MPIITDEQIASGKQPFYAIIGIIWWLSHTSDEAQEQKKPVGATFNKIFKELQKFKDLQDIDLQDFEDLLGKKGKAKKGSATEKSRLGDQLKLLVDQGFITREGTPRYYHYLSTGLDEHMRRLERINSVYRSYELDQVFPKAADFRKEDLGNKPEFCLFGFPGAELSNGKPKNCRILEDLEKINTILRCVEKEAPGGRIAFFWGLPSEVKDPPWKVKTDLKQKKQSKIKAGKEKISD